MAVKTVFDDQDFLQNLAALMVRDVRSLHRCAHYLDSKDFTPLAGEENGEYRWIVVERALEYYGKYKNPIGKGITADLISYGKEIGMTERVVDEILEYAKGLLKKKLRAPDTFIDKVLQYKREAHRARALEKMVDLHSTGKLDDDTWLSITHEILQGNNGYESHEYFEELEDRVERREVKDPQRRAPFFLIEPLDSLVRGIGPGNVGLLMAPYKRGKGLMFVHFAKAFTLQGLNTLLITLEDPREEVEDRLDSSLTSVPIKELVDKPKMMARRFSRIRRMVKNRLRIVDRTETGVSVGEIERILLHERDRGFLVQVLLVDYDDEINADNKSADRRFQFAQIYKDLRRLASRERLIIWTASQTQRSTEGLKILSGSRLAEDISKVRKVAMAIGLGQGEWGDDSIYLHVAAHKYDRDRIGAHIVTDKSRMLIYDPEKTDRRRREQAALEEEGE